MAIKFFCMACGMKLAAQDKHAGQSLTCPGCGYRMNAPLQTVRVEGDSPNLPDVPEILLQIRTEKDQGAALRGLTLAACAAPNVQPPAMPPAIPRALWRRPIAILGAAVSLLVTTFVLAYLAWPHALALMRRREMADQSRTRNQNPLSKAKPQSARDQTPALTAKPIAPSKPTMTRDYSRWVLGKTFRWSTEHLNCVAFSPDGRTIAVGGGTSRRNPIPRGYGEAIETGLVQLWDVETGEAKLRIAEPENAIESLTFYPDGSSLAVAHRRDVKVVNPKDGSLRFALQAHGVPAIGLSSVIALNLRENLLVTGGDTLWDSRNGESRGYSVDGLSKDNVAFSPDGKLLCADLVLYDGKLAERYGPLAVSLKNGQCMAAAFSHDSKLVGTGFVVWSTSARKIIWERDPGTVEWPFGVAFTPDDRLLLSHDGSGRFWVSDVTTGNVVGSLNLQKHVRGMALSPDGAFLVTVPRDNTEPIMVWLPVLRPAD